MMIAERALADLDAWQRETSAAGLEFQPAAHSTHGRAPVGLAIDE